MSNTWMRRGKAWYLNENASPYGHGWIWKFYATNFWIVNRKVHFQSILMQFFYCKICIKIFDEEKKRKIHIAIFFTALWKSVSIHKVICTKYPISLCVEYDYILHILCYGVTKLDHAVYMVHWLKHELLSLDSNVRAKLTIMLKIKKFSKSFFCHILETLNKNYE